MTRVHNGALDADVVARARADQVATLYRQWHRTTLSMGFGALLLWIVLRDHARPSAMTLWLVAILANQAWRGLLTRAHARAAPSLAEAPRWGWFWSIGSMLAGALWGVAAVAMFPDSEAHQALLVVCLFGVVLGGLNLTAVYKPSFYGFVVPALAPLIARVAVEGDDVHLFTALVMAVVLGFVLVYGHRLNDLLTQSLAMRYENVDLIAELQAQTRAADAARAAAESANRAKSHFLAAASHDLRQPLHAMGLFAAALLAQAREPAVKPLVESIRVSVEALEALFEQLMDLSRLEAGAWQPCRSAVALQPLLERLHADLAPQAQAFGLRLSFSPTSLTVHTDAALLTRILRNLIVNALRYTREGGVVVGARRRGEYVRIDVVDSGVGIAADDRTRIFDEFVQVEGAAPRHKSGRGMGLGLAIVRRLAALLDHALDVASTPGRGSRFSVTMRRAVPARVTEAAAQSREGAEGAGERDAFAGRHVLVIDDDPTVVSGMSALLQAWGAHASGGATVEQALAVHDSDPIRAGRIDLVIADLRLADGACGIEAVRDVRLRAGRAVPAIMVSGDTSDGARAEVAAAGIQLLAKPLLPAALRAGAARAWRTGQDRGRTP